jgi:hypothetical protein
MFLKNFIKKHWPIITALFLLYFIIGILLTISIINNQSHFIYSLDDVYIHLSIAKNFVESSAWSVNGSAFSSSTSSPLWTFILSITYLISSINEYVPFFLNLLVAAFLLLICYNLLKKTSLSSSMIFAVMLSLIFFIPIPFLVFTGLEHLFHTLLMILYVYLSSDLISNKNYKPLASESMYIKKYKYLAILTFFIVLIRYESLFFVFTSGILFVLRKKYLLGIFIIICGLLPITIYGIISMSQGWPFIPAPILIKANLPDFSTAKDVLKSFGLKSLIQLINCIPLLFLLIASLVLVLIRYNSEKNLWKISTIFLIMFIIGLLFHMQFSSLFIRYEAYLVGLGIFGVVFDANKYLTNSQFHFISRKHVISGCIFSLVVFFILLPFFERGISNFQKTIRATNNIYEQQYQVASFLNLYFNYQSIAANDIGAINYFATTQCLDLWGISNRDVLLSKLEKTYNTEKINDISNHYKVKIAVVYEKWFKNYGGLPGSWKKKCSWVISNNVICGDSIVTFYALETSFADSLTKSLKEYSTRLPKGVKSFFY